MAGLARQGSFSSPSALGDSTGISGSTYPNMTLNAFTQNKIDDVDTPRPDVKNTKGQYKCSSDGGIRHTSRYASNSRLPY